MRANLGELVASAWDAALRESPDPFDGRECAELLGFLPTPTYRERLDRQPVNCFREAIPRIVIVRNNLRRLGKSRRPPRLPA